MIQEYITSQLEDTVPLNEQDKAWIRETIQTAHKARGWSKLARFIKDWSGTGAAVAIVLFTATQWTAYVEFRTTTNNELGELAKRLDKIDGNLAKSNISAQASLSPTAFSAGLPDLKSSLSKIREQKLSVSSDLLGDIQQRMVGTDTYAVGYWPAAAEIITERSELLNNLRICRVGAACIVW